MHALSIGCLFRNEAHSIVEWIEHYLLHGASHFYLIDDGSDDNSCELIEPYVKKGLVSLFNAKWERYLGRQRDMYNHYILPLLCESKWLLMLDMDEYMWSPHSLDLKTILGQCEYLGQVQVDHTLFGSSGHESQPSSIVASFTRRSSQMPTKSPGNRKYFVNCSFKFSSLNIHHATFVDKEDETKRFLLLNDNYFRMNHYSCQSREFWSEVKCKRGDGDFWRKRTMKDFDEIDLNDDVDETLMKQNLPVFEKLGFVLE
jgi:hypothetical protein